MAGTIQDVKVDGALHVHQLRREARYWEPANDLGDCGVVTAAKSLPGVSGWLGSERLAEVYRLIPWYPFPCVDGDWIQRRQDLLQPVRQGNHFPVFRVNPKQPWTLSLAVSVLSPVLDHPSGCSALNGSGDEMWWERVAPLGWRQDTVSICDSPMAVGGLPDVDAVVWGSTQPAMTQEAAVTDCCAFRGACGLLADILPAPPDPDALPRHIPPGELQLIRDMVVQLSRLLETAMQPFLAFGFGYDLTGTQETIASTFGDGIEAARNQLMQPFLAELPARLASCYLWDALHQHLQRSAEWLAESSKSSPTWPSRVAAQWPSLAHRGGASVDPGAYLRAVTASALAELDPYARSPAGRLVESLCNAFRGLEGHILIEPMRWVSGASSMHLSRRLGLLVDPAEFRETYTDLNANSWNWGRNADITILAHDVNGAALAFAKRMDQGFVTVVPAGFPDEAVLALVREAADHWQVHVPGLESAAEPCDRATPRPGSPDGERRFALKDLVVTVEAEGLRISSASDPQWRGPFIERSSKKLSVGKSSLARRGQQQNKQVQLMVALASKKPDGGTWSRLELQEKVLGTGPEAAGYKIGSDFRNIETRLLDALAHVASGYVVRMTDDDEGHEKQVRAAIQEAWQKSRSLVVTIKVEPGHGVLLPGDKDFGSGKAKSGERARRPAVG